MAISVDGWPDDKVLMETAVLGKEVEDFLASDIGTYLVSHAQEQAALAYDQLKRVHPWRRRRIQELQNVIWRSEQFRDWLAQAYESGRSAHQLLEEQRG